jgi:hypothetical protein
MASCLREFEYHRTGMSVSSAIELKNSRYHRKDSPSRCFRKPVAVSEIMALCSVQYAVQARARRRYFRDSPVSAHEPRTREDLRQGPKSRSPFASPLASGRTNSSSSTPLPKT